jgi:hypothetical protein
MQENLPELKKTLQMIQLGRGDETHSVVEKTVYLANGSEDPKIDVGRAQPSKTSRRKTRQT